METNTLLLIIWVILGFLIFILGVINSFSIMTLENRINNIDSNGSKTVWSFIKSNWDIFLTIFLISLFISSCIISYSRNWYKEHNVYTVIIVILVILISILPILIKRLLNKKK